MSNKIDRDYLLRKILKYLIEGFTVSIVLTLIFKNPKYQNHESIIIIGLTIAAVFAILDMFIPVISHYARKGTGFGLGMNLTGLPGLNFPVPIPI
jgi:hypothetical protein